MVASDRISTYDAVHPTPIPDKGKVLTGLSVFWFEKTAPDRRQPPDLGRPTGVPDGGPRPGAGRCASCEMLPVECVVRGYITGSGWKDYQATGAVSGIELPAGPARVRAAARADLHAEHEGRGRPRRGDRLRARGRAGRRSGADGARARRVDRAVLVRRRARARARRDPRRHEVRVRARRRRRAGGRRRGADAGLLALLAGRRL